jgi:hypothetical protein
MIALPLTFSMSTSVHPVADMAGVVSAAAIQAIAHSLDIPNLSEQAAKALAPDVEYKLRELIQV